MTGRYRRIQVVGKGSFGCCWLVENDARDRCILKQIDVSRMPAKQKEEAANEVKVLSKLRHPFIINYLESYVEDGALCIITEFAERGDLYHVIHRQKKANRYFLETEVFRWFTQITLALKHMHDRHILHRDLKTQNVFLTGPGQGAVRLGDFGIARVLQHTQDCARTAIGTPYYLSPEICQEKPYSFKSDIWSLGCILYELLTLQHAFDSDSMRGLVMKILKGKPPQVPQTFSTEARGLVPELLTKDPKDRPSTEEVLSRPKMRAVIRELLREVEAQQQSLQPPKASGGSSGHSPRAAASVPANAGGVAAVGTSPTTVSGASAKSRGASLGDRDRADHKGGSSSVPPRKREPSRAERQSGGIPSHTHGTMPPERSPQGAEPRKSSPSSENREPKAVKQGAHQQPTSAVKPSTPWWDLAAARYSAAASREQAKRPEILGSVPSPQQVRASRCCRGSAEKGDGGNLLLRTAHEEPQHHQGLASEAIREPGPKPQQEPQVQNPIDREPWQPQGIPERTPGLREVAERHQKAMAQRKEQERRRRFQERNQQDEAEQAEHGRLHSQQPAGAEHSSASHGPRAPHLLLEPKPATGGVAVANPIKDEGFSALTTTGSPCKGADSEDAAELISTLREGLQIHLGKAAQLPPRPPPGPLIVPPYSAAEHGGEKTARGMALAKPGSTAGDNIQDANSVRFLKPDGQAVDLPVSEQDTLSYRIEALRVYLEAELGLGDFLCIYRFLIDSAEQAENEQRTNLSNQSLESMVSPKTISFLPLVHQLIVCEDQCFSQR